MTIRACSLQVWEEKTPSSKFGRDKDYAWKEVYVESGKRKVPRGDIDEQTGKSWDGKRPLSAERRALEGGALKRQTSFVDIEDASLFEEDLNYKGLLRFLLLLFLPLLLLLPLLLSS